MQNKIRRKNKRNFRYQAESLIETLIAITVIVIATTSAMILVRTSLVGNQVIGEKTVALNLALEGIEAVKNIRDTNYLNLSSDPDSCWNSQSYLNASLDTSDCGTYAIDEDTTYYLAKNFHPDYNFQTWILNAVVDYETDGILSLYTYEITEGPLTGETIPIYLQNSMPITYFTETVEDAFQRFVDFEYDTAEESFEVTVTVNWLVDDVEKSLVLTRTVANVY